MSISSKILIYIINNIIKGDGPFTHRSTNWVKGQVAGVKVMTMLHDPCILTLNQFGHLNAYGAKARKSQF